MKHILLFLSFWFLVGKISAQDGVFFTFSCGDKPLKINEMIYKSKRGLTFEVCQCQFFVSNLTVHYKDGKKFQIKNSVHYTDVEIPKTLFWIPSQDFSLKNADSLFFTFGLDSLENRSYRFKNPPENLMFWPDYLGGGYHYMKTNILYLTSDNQTNAFNCHIGRGQVYNSENEPISFIENDVKIKIPLKTFIKDGKVYAIINLDILTMFDYPNAALFTDYRGIMNNQEAMKMFSQNVKAAFEK
ncbi:MAG: hypothetical protein IKR41_06945 [Bacteroidales bacterium]|nr:hypothetical protein [Bacteroidales bacterium]